MASRLNTKSILALLAAFVVVGIACVSWVPSIFPLGRSLEIWLEQRVAFFQELQLAQEGLRDAEFSHHSFILTGDDRSLDSFNEASKSIKHHLSMLNSMRQSDLMFGEKTRNLSARVTFLLDELKQSADVRKAQGKGPAEQLIQKSGENRELREIVRQIARMEEDEFEAVRNKAGEYNRMIGPYPWIVVIVVLVGTGAVTMLALGGRRSEASDAEKIEQLTNELTLTKEQLDRLSRTDMLTEVNNLRGLEKALAIEENKITRAGGHMIAVSVNCDNFTQINDKLGIAAGDIVLKDVARRILATLRPSDHVARVDNRDEFLVLLPDTQLAYGLRVAERIRMAVSDNPMHNLQEVVQVTVSIGVAMLPHKVANVQEVLSLTRGALRRSKVTGKNKVSLAREGGGEAEMPPGSDEIVNSLLDISNFRTVYQPIIDLATEQVAGFEIYTRGPDGAFENPGDLFRVCIDNNILTQVDLQCLKLGIEMSADVAENMRVHVNLFPSTILDTPIERLLEIFPQDKGGRTYCVEISEQQFIGDPTFMREHVQKLRSAGVLVAIDDIGFGRNSLETLIFLEPDVIKVDRTYVTGISEDKYKVRLLKRLTNVAKSLGAEVVAEGVERREDLPVLQELGIHFAQGFLWGELLQVLPANPKDQRTLTKQ